MAHHSDVILCLFIAGRNTSLRALEPPMFEDWEKNHAFELSSSSSSAESDEDSDGEEKDQGRAFLLQLQ